MKVKAFLWVLVLTGAAISTGWGEGRAQQAAQGPASSGAVSTEREVPPPGQSSATGTSRAATAPATDEPPAAGETSSTPDGNDPAPESALANPVDADLEALIRKLEDPERRETLIRDLRGLLAAAAETESALVEPDDVVNILLEEISERTDVVRSVAQSSVDAFNGLPALLTWLQGQVLDEATREVWLWVGLRAALVIGFGVIGYLLVAVALRGARKRITEAEPGGLIARLPWLLFWLFLELLPVLTFAAVSYASLFTLQFGAMPRMVVIPLINAVLIVRSSIAATRVVLAAKAPGLRLFPMSDDLARYYTNWTVRLIGVGVYGSLGLEAGTALGLPWALQGLLTHVLFFFITVLTMVVIIQSRETVSAALSSLASHDHSAAVRRLPWRTLAAVWHVLAMLYVFFVFMVWALKVPGGFQALAQATLGSAAIIVVGGLLWRGLGTWDDSDGADSETDDDEGRSHIEQRASRYLPLATFLARGAVLVGTMVLLFEVWGLGTLEWLMSDDGTDFLGQVLTVAVIVAISAGTWEFASFLIERAVTDTDDHGNLRLSNRTRTLLNILRNLMLVVLSIIALFLILAEVGVDLAPLLAGAGVIGLAIGFGSQKLVQDIITGLFVLLGDTMRVGDVVEVAGRTGVVEVMSMRTVQLRDYGGLVHTIPYSTIDTVTNYTKDYSYALFDIGVAYRENVDDVMNVLLDIGRGLQRDPVFRRMILEPLEMAGVERFAPSAVIIRARFKTKPLRQWEVAREFNRRVKNRFDELGIEIPFPHQTIYFGTNRQGEAAPAHIRVSESGVPDRQPEERDLMSTVAPPPLLAKRGA